MKLTALARPAKPWFHLLAASPSDATDALWALEQSAEKKPAIRFIRGHKALTAASFFDEASAALQFPYYFGENWDAFHDCLTDLEWLRASALVMCLVDALRVLEKEPDEASKFARVIETAAQFWNEANAARAFHVVFQAAPADEAAVLKRWHGLGLHLNTLH